MSLTATGAPLADRPRDPTAELRPVRQRRSFATMRAVLALVLREMSTTNGRSPGGYIWAVLQPAAAIALLTVVFALIARKPPLGTSFPIFYATGMVPFLMYNDISRKLAASVDFSRALLVYPSVTFVDALIARFVLNLLTQILVGYVIFTGILLMFESRVAPNLPAIALGFAMTAALAAGIGTLNCFIMGVFPVWRQIWGIFTRPLVFVSCIFFLFETVPQPYRDWLWYNPLIHVVGQMRHGFYPYYDATYVSPGYIFAISLVLTALGIVLLARYVRDILNQ